MSTRHNPTDECLNKYKYNFTYPCGLGQLYVNHIKKMRKTQIDGCHQQEHYEPKFIELVCDYRKTPQTQAMIVEIDRGLPKQLPISTPMPTSISTPVPMPTSISTPVPMPTSISMPVPTSISTPMPTSISTPMPTSISMPVPMPTPPQTPSSPELKNDIVIDVTDRIPTDFFELSKRLETTKHDFQTHETNEDSQDSHEQSKQIPKIGKLKLEQLRQMCKLNSLSTVGTKEVLYNRYYFGKD